MTKTRHWQFLWFLAAVAALACLPRPVKAQSAASAEALPEAPAAVAPAKPDSTYTQPTEKEKFKNYLFDAFGPNPILGAAFSAGLNQATNVPPDWGQGGAGYGRRFGSHYGISVVSTTTRYGLSRLFNEDGLYYACECRGVFPRLGHALLSTLTARRGEDGHRVFSVPALVAPYAGTMVATYGWYPSRYSAKDAFRMGNYGLLTSAGENISMEFIFSGSHSLFHRMHLKQAQRDPYAKAARKTSDTPAEDF